MRQRLIELALIEIKAMWIDLTAELPKFSWHHDLVFHGARRTSVIIDAFPKRHAYDMYGSTPKLHPHWIQFANKWAEIGLDVRTCKLIEEKIR